jgi:hypothetical protein
MKMRVLDDLSDKRNPLITNAVSRNRSKSLEGYAVTVKDLGIVHGAAFVIVLKDEKSSEKTHPAR